MADGTGNIAFCQPAKDGFAIVQQFEQEFARIVGDEAVAVNSGYSALFLAVKALGITGEVIVPEFTMIASANAIREAGATPVFVDVNDDGNINHRKIEAALTERTQAIMPVHIYGMSCDMARIRSIARNYRLAIIHDAAEAHGTDLGDCSGEVRCYSFYANKLISTGEGGAIVSDRKDVVEECQKLRSHYFGSGYTHAKVGYGLRMNPYGALEGLQQLKRWDELVAARKHIAEFYDEHLTWPVKPTPRKFYWMYGIRVPDKEGLRKYLLEKGIETRDFFVPMSMQEPYKRPYAHLNAYKLYESGILLPTMPGLTDEQLRYICVAISSYMPAP